MEAVEAFVKDEEAKHTVDAAPVKEGHEVLVRNRNISGTCVGITVTPATKKLPEKVVCSIKERHDNPNTLRTLAHASRQGSEQHRPHRF